MAGRRINLTEKSRADVIRSFCQWTSVRGLHHVLRAEHPILRFIWAVFVALMLVANIGLIALLMTHYLRLNTIENIRTMQGVAVAFPQITLCNVDPVNSDRVYCLKNINAKGCNMDPKHKDILEKYMIASNYYAQYKSTPVWKILEDPSMVAIFYQLIGMEAASQIGHQLDDFIIPTFCELTTRQKGGILLKRKCQDANVVPISFITYKYFNCYTLAITDPEISNAAVRLSVVLYLDEEEDLNCRPHCTHEFTEWAGAKVVVHPVGTYPDIDQMGMNLLPGASNQILVDEIRRIEKKNLPPKPCEQEANKTLSLAYFDMNKQKFQTREMKYTASLCIQLLSQVATMERCQCVDFLMPIPGSHLDRVGHLPFCGNLSRSNVLYSLKCNQQVRQNNSRVFHELCREHCVQMQYNYELTQLRWPQKPRVLKYYSELKDRIYYDRKFKIYEEIEAMSRINASLALEKLQKTDVFEKNFLQLDVNRPNFDTLVSYTENEEYTLTTLLSQIGGICSIFLSFTCVSVLELVELMFRLTWVTWPLLASIIGIRSASSNASNRNSDSHLGNSDIETDANKPLCVLDSPEQTTMKPDAHPCNANYEKPANNVTPFEHQNTRPYLFPANQASFCKTSHSMRDIKAHLVGSRSVQDEMTVRSLSAAHLYQNKL
ncbi:FMRFamide-activated amiloride-sensitive sodium channel [Fasciolopsis buskii]|uniref:FMRFamide-activated amiloride-sensitive sodium channel n=1 Tax=Fasciolopsis buskii TaxID=27845 RepID=A0A8E0RNR3_9TREM|nr:FMRFamide-activated amiloride-sensitive sodium channel [Fasciolopsis buski]